jgi:hypothetical protein
MKYLIGFIVIAIGSFLVIKTELLLSWFGRIDFAERYLGSDGGSRLFYKLLGILIITFAFLGLTGILGGMLRGLFGPLIGVLNSGSSNS